MKKDRAVEVEQALATWASGTTVEGMTSGLLRPVAQGEHARSSKDVLRSRLRKLGEEIGRNDLASVMLDAAREISISPEEDFGDLGDGWWKTVLQGDVISPLRKYQGGVLVGFCVNVSGTGFDITVPVTQAVQPRVLIVDPGTSGGELTTLRLGEREILSGTRVPIGAFQPASWVNSEQMRRAVSVAGPRLLIGESIEIAGRLDEPGLFRAVIWCVGYDEQGRLLGAPEGAVSSTSKLDAAVVDTFTECLAALPAETRAGLLSAIPKTFEPLMAAMSAAVQARIKSSSIEKVVIPPQQTLSAHLNSIDDFGDDLDPLIPQVRGRR